MKDYEFFDHTADVGLIARGKDLPELFQNAALGLMALVVDPGTVSPGGIRERIDADGSDLETLLVNWLNQVLFLYSVQQMVFCRFGVKLLSVPEKGDNYCVVAEGEGELLDPGRHEIIREVKSPTFHDLRVEKPEEFWQARIIFDV